MLNDVPPIDVRHLSSSNKDEFDAGSQAAQIFSGAMFCALTCYLLFSNSTRMSYIQRASLEKRLTVCCHINTIVAAISCFLNIFQLTEVDNWALPGQRQFVVDIARPVEWILTCPMMQLSLVLMGGSRIPEYRRTLMPASSAAVLLMGTITLFVDKPLVFLVWAAGLCIHSGAMWVNRLQILEHSRGLEGLLTGDSEFRKATLILMITWLPFPLWYICSPEGLSLIEDITLIQMGWAFLNITAKFTLIFYIQRVKDNYCNRLKITREMKGAPGERNLDAVDDEDEGTAQRKVKGDLRACVVETMNFLGMAENTERFLRLLQQANICTLDDIARIEKSDCDSKQLPSDLITAVQKRMKVWALEMVDDAEQGLEAGERHYEVRKPKGRILSKDDAEPRPEQTERIALADGIPGPGYTVLDFTPATQGYSNAQFPISPASAPATFSNAQFTNLFNGNEISNAHTANGFSKVQAAHPAHGASNAYARNHDSAKMDMSLETLQHKLMEDIEKKLERVITAVGRKVEKSEEKLEMQIKRAEEKFSTGLKDVEKAVERSPTHSSALTYAQPTAPTYPPSPTYAQPTSPTYSSAPGPNLSSSCISLIESKVENVLMSFGQQQREQIQQIRTDLSSLLQQSHKESLQRIQESTEQTFRTQCGAQTFPGMTQDQPFTRQPSCSTEMTTQDHKRLDDAVREIKSVASELNSSMTQLSSGWSHQIQMKLGALDEKQGRMFTELDDSIRRNMDQVMREGCQDICSAVAQQTKLSTDTLSNNLDHSIEGVVRMERSLQQVTRELSEECAKNISMSIGVVGNSLRLQLDGVHSKQDRQQADLEKGVDALMERICGNSASLMERIQQQPVVDQERVNKIEKTLRESSDNAMKCQLEDLKNFQKQIEAKNNEQMDYLKKMNEKILKESSDNVTKRQIEDLKGFQKGIEASMKDQVEHLKKMNEKLLGATSDNATKALQDLQGFQKQSEASMKGQVEYLNKMNEKTLKESTDNATKRQLEDLKGFQKAIEASMKDQVEYLKKVNEKVLGVSSDNATKALEDLKGFQKHSEASLKDFQKQIEASLRDQVEHVKKNSEKILRESSDNATHRQLEDLKSFHQSIEASMKDQVEYIKKTNEKTLRESADNATQRQLEDLKGFQRQIEAAMKDQVEYLKKTNSVITGALGGPMGSSSMSSSGREW